MKEKKSISCSYSIRWGAVEAYAIDPKHDRFQIARRRCGRRIDVEIQTILALLRRTISGVIEDALCIILLLGGSCIVSLAKKKKKKKITTIEVSRHTCKLLYTGGLKRLGLQWS